MTIRKWVAKVVTAGSSDSTAKQGIHEKHIGKEERKKRKEEKKKRKKRKKRKDEKKQKQMLL